MHTSLNSYLKSIIPGFYPEENPLTTISKNNPGENPLEIISTKILDDMSRISLVNSSNTPVYLERIINSVLQLDIMVRAYVYIENAAQDKGVSQEIRDSLKNRAITEYKKSLQKLDIDGAPEESDHEKQISCIARLIKLHINRKKIDINETDTTLKTQLHRACRDGNLEKIKLLIFLGADLNARDSRRLTPLSLALEVGNKNCAKFLIEAGADLDIINQYGRTALHIACEKDLVDIVSLLIEGKKVDLNAKDSNILTPLNQALKKGNEKCAKLLIEAGADVSIANYYNDTSLHFACEKDLVDIVSLLIEGKKVDLNAKNKIGEYPLNKALKLGNEKCIKLLIEAGADVNIKYLSDNTPLHVACAKNLEDLFVFLIKSKKVDLNAKNILDESPLNLALRIGNKKCLKLLIEEGANVNTADCNGKTPLHFACAKGFEDIVTLFIEGQKVDLNAKDNKGFTPLNLALNIYKEKCAKLLIEAGADVNIADNCGTTPLHFVCSMGLEDIVTLLIKGQKVNLNAKDNKGFTPLNLALNIRNEKCAKFLIEAGADVNIADNCGTTPLHIACSKGLVDIIALLIEGQKVDLNAKDHKGFTPLNLAINIRNERCAKLLIEAGANVNIANNCGTTPLHIACSKGLIDIITLLIEGQKVDLNAKDNTGVTPLNLAITIRNEKCAKLLIEAGADVIANATTHLYILPIDRAGITTPWSILINQGNFDDLITYEIADLLISKGVDVNGVNNEGFTQLYKAVTQGNEKLAKFLIKVGADVNIADKKGNTPLHTACQKGLVDIVTLLIKSKKVDLNAKDANGSTPLNLAIEEHDEICAKLLIEAGADVNIADNNGETPLHIACVEELEDIIKLLIEKEADANIADKLNNTPLHIACGRGFKNIVSLLIEGKKVDLNAKNDTGVTPLYAATSGGKEILVKLLIEVGADVNIADKNCNTPLHIACLNKREDIVALLSEAKSVNLNAKNNMGVTPLMTACLNSLKNAIALLIEKGADVNVTDQQGNTLLLLAFHPRPNVDIIKALLKGNADPKIPNGEGNTPWSILIKQGDFKDPDTYEVADLLVSNGVDINTPVMLTSGITTTFLMKIALTNRINAIPDLVRKKNADLYMQNNIGSSAISFMVSSKNPLLLSILKDLNIDIERAKPDNNGETLLQIANRSNNFKVMEYLIERGMSLTEKNSYYETPLQFYNIITLADKFTIFSNNYLVYVDNAITDDLNNCNSLNDLILLKLPILLQSMKAEANPLEVALVYNNVKLGRAIAKELGQQRFQEYLDKLPINVAKSLKESIKYDLNEAHLANKIALIPEKPEEQEYQLEALLGIFDELTDSDPEKFKKYIIDKRVDGNRPISNLRKRLESHINNCKRRSELLGVSTDQLVEFWESIEIAMTNTIKVLKTLKGSEEEVYEKKARLICEYLDIIGYCGTRLDVEFDKLYYMNNGEMRTFPDEIYFQLSERRRITLEGLAPRHPQSIHFIQNMLLKLTKYNIPIKEIPDLFPEKPRPIYVEDSFKRKYLDGLFGDIKNYLESNKNIQEMFFQWLEERGRPIQKPSLPVELTNKFFDYLQNHNALPQDASKIEKDLFTLFKDSYGLDNDLTEEDTNILNDKNIRSQLIDGYFTQEGWMKSDFEALKKSGNDAFSNLDPDLQKVIIESDMEGKLSLFQNDTKAIPEEKKKLLNKYKETKLSVESTNRFFDYVQNHNALPPNASKTDEVLYSLIKDTSILSDANVRTNLIREYFVLESGLMNDNFKKITKDGNESFPNLDPDLQKAIVESGMEGKLSLFQFTDEYIRNVKQKLLDRYKETKFPKIVKDEDVSFLLQELGILTNAPDAPEWLI